MTPEPAQPAESPEARAREMLARQVEEDGKAHPFYGYDRTAYHIREASGAQVWAVTAIRAMLAFAASTARPTERGAVEVEAECACLLAAYLTKEIGRIMHQAEHWAANGKPLAVHHRLMKADDYYQILCLMERDPNKGWKLPFDEIRDDLNRKDMHAPGNYPPSRALYRYRDPAFVVEAIAQSATDQAAEVERLREALAIGDSFVRACFSAWSCGEPYHRVKTMMDRAEEFQAALAALDTHTATGRTRGGEAPSEDWLADVLDDSLDMDWTGRVGAKAIIAAWDNRYVG